MRTWLALFLLILTLTGFGIVPQPARALPYGSVQIAMARIPEEPLRLAQSNCGHAVSAVQAQTGISGRLVGVERSGGRVVCVVLILRPSPGGNRPPTPTKIRVPAQ